MEELKITVDDLFSKKDIKKQLTKLKFEQGMALLEGLVSKVESGALPLDKSVEAYEHASELVTHLRALLGSAEGKLKLLQPKSEN